MRSSNATFDTANALAYKTPVYLVHFDVETIDYVNHKVTSPTNTLKQYLISISGLSQKVTPEEGKSSIGEIKIVLQDYNDEITALLATDTYYFHRRKTVVKAGYLGFSEANMLTVLTGWVTDIKMTTDLLAYEFTVTDPQKWLQRKIFRGSEDDTITIQGNPINIYLALLTSTGAGTNGNYDWYAAEWGVGIDTDWINVSGIEAVRDNWYPGDSNYMKFTITKREKAKDWLEREILKMLNIYPVIDGDGKINLKPFKPPIASRDTMQSFDESNIELPKYDMNLAALINEVEFHYDYNGSDYATKSFYDNGTSINNRGPGKKPLVFKPRGVHTSNAPASISGRATDIIKHRKAKIFGRFLVPPIKLNFPAFFSRWLSEAGDIPTLTHSKIPDAEAGTRGITARRMEIINRSIDWKKGRVNIELLDTGFNKGRYGAISPSMTITAGASGTSWTVSVADAAKYEVGWEVRIHDAGMKEKATVTILTINTTTGVITSDNIGQTPSNGWKVSFADYGNCTDDQKLYSFIYASGHSMTEADYITP